MPIAHRPAFVRGAKALFLLKLEGEPSFGVEARAVGGANGRTTYVANRVDPLSPADRAGITRGDELYSIQVLGVDRDAYFWCDNALQRVEQIREIWVVKIWVTKRPGNRISELQQRRYDCIQHKLTRAKSIRLNGIQTSEEFIQSQLEKVVVLIYDYEHAYFGSLWKTLSEEDRADIAIPVARSFVSETRLPGLAGATVDGAATPLPSLPSTPAHSTAHSTAHSPAHSPRFTPQSVDMTTDPEATESEVSTPPRARTPDESEGGETPPRRHVFIPLATTYAPNRPSIDVSELTAPIRAKKKQRMSERISVSVKEELAQSP